MLSISTAYHKEKNRTWEKLLAETLDLGFSAVELNVEIPAAWMARVERSVSKGEIVVSSLHNYCPVIEGLPSNRTIYSGFLMTSDNEDERRLSVEYTKRTIEWARRLGARVVVVHAGEVETEPSGREFVRYLQQFGRNGKLYPQYEEAIARDRQKKSPHYIERLSLTLEEILPFAEENNVTLGLENRYYFHEIPNIDETRELLERFAGAPVGYWHDTGHAEIFARQKWLENHEDALRAMRGKIVGMHLHDVRGLSDHFAPGSGELDLSFLKPYVTGDMPLVVEAHAKASASEVKASVEYLKKTILP